jgi:hypothetical protein
MVRRASVRSAIVRALCLDVVRAQVEFVLVVLCGRDLVDLLHVRGPNERAWNRMIGMQAINAGIVVLALNGLETVGLIAILKPWGGLGFVIATVPAAAGMGGLVWALSQARRRRAWTPEQAWSMLEDRRDRYGQWLLALLCVAALTWAFA